MVVRPCFSRRGNHEQIFLTRSLRRAPFGGGSPTATLSTNNRRRRPMHSRLATCVVLVAGCALLAIPVSLPAHCDSSSHMLGHFAPPTQPAVSPAGVHPPTLDAPLIGDRVNLTEVLWQTAGTGTRFQTGVAQTRQRCIPIGRACFGPGRPHCCPAPFPHHSFCSNRRGWGICVES
jgi:hypothetical protein